MAVYTKWKTKVVQAICSIHIASAIQCDLYMAESTIPHAGLGIFSAIERNPGDSVGEGDVCIPILDVNNYHKEVWNPFHDYVWGGEIMGMKLEIESADKDAYCPVSTRCTSSTRCHRLSILFPLCNCENIGLGLRNQLQLGFDQRCEVNSDL